MDPNALVKLVFTWIGSCWPMYTCGCCVCIIHLSSRFWPTHTRPPWRGVGLLHERWRTWKPIPQVVLQGDQEVQGVHAPFLWWRRSNVSLWIGLACTRLSCLYCLRRRSWLRSHSSSHVAQRNSTTFLRANTEKHAAIHHHIHTYGQFSHTGRVRTSLQSEPSPFLAMVLTTSPLCCLLAIRPIFVAHIKGKWASETNQIKGCVFTCLFHFKCNNRLRVWDKHLWLRSDIYYCKRLIDCF